MTMKRADPPLLSTMRVLIAEVPPDYTIDGTDVGSLQVGGEYDLPTGIAEVLLGMQVAVLPIGAGKPLLPRPPRSIQ